MPVIAETIVSYPDPSREDQEGVWQHVIHCRVCAHCTVCANQVTELKYLTFIENVLTKQWCLQNALVVARVRTDYDKLLPKQREAVVVFISVFIHLPAGYRKSFCRGYLPSRLTICTVQYSPLMGGASLPPAQHKTRTAPAFNKANNNLHTSVTAYR